MPTVYPESSLAHGGRRQTPVARGGRRENRGWGSSPWGWRSRGGGTRQCVSRSAQAPHPGRQVRQVHSRQPRQSTAPRLDGQFSFQAALFLQRAPGPCPRRMAAVGGGCLPGNGTAPGKPSPGVQESTQGQEQGEGKGSSGPPGSEPQGRPRAATARTYKRQTSPRVENRGKKGGGCRRTGEAVHTVKVNAV